MSAGHAIERRLRRALVAVSMLCALLVLVVAGVLFYWRAYLLGPEGEAFTRGPYLVRVDGSSAQLSWRTRADGAIVDLRATGPDGREVSARGEFFEGLMPGSEYGWVASIGEGARASGTFTTAPRDLAEPLRFAVIADYGSGNEHEWAVARTVAAMRPRFVVTAGDNSYLSAPDIALDRNLFRPLGEVLRHAPLVLGLGDHDSFPPGPGAITRAFDIPEHGRHVMRYGPVQVVVLGDRADSDAVAFARQALAEPGPEVRFVAVHRPLQRGNPLLPILRRRQVAAVFSGHLHRYERRIVEGVQTFTVGTGGQGPGEAEFTARSPGAAVSLLDYGALRVEVSMAGVSAAFVDERGRTLDRWSSR